MTLPLFRTIAMTIACAGAVPAAHATPLVNEFSSGSGDSSKDWAVPGFDSEIGFVAEGRIGAHGGTSTIELKVAPDTSTPYWGGEAD
ncbi:hypothetical protein [Ectothiorhodospira haloalkaliphila]|uniref:hypothetical protein n=1 Tax=Ectothiorhodospira haloalkaliphila TaxID=421628 RepID=UPI000FFBEEF1|nr:hypothetical protein [Ectothiorhodospira haloalkaliphila]